LVTIRKATEADIPEILSMGRDMTDEGPWTVTLSEDVAQSRIESSIEAGCCFVADAGDKLVGLTVGFPASYWYSEEEFVGELALYVRPGFRLLGIAKDLIDSLELWASQRCIQDVIISPASGVADNATTKMLEKLGYARIATSMRKRL